MSKVAYLECPTGVAGDMCLGALVDAGVPLDYLAAGLDKLGNAADYHLWAELVHRNGQQATKVHVDLKAATQSSLELHSAATIAAYHADHDHSHAHHCSHADSAPDRPSKSDPHHLTFANPVQHSHTRHLPEIEQMIQAAGLPSRAEAWSLAVFRQLSAAEGAVHGISPDAVHFHEVGATDAIVDIVGTCLGLDWLDVEQIYCSPLPTGGGTIRAAHGRLPVPAPAVLKLWEMRQIPIYSNGIDRELVTPTGAAIVTTLATQFGPPPTMILQRVGLGAGSIDLPLPNILRLWLGESNPSTPLKPQTSLAKRHEVLLKPENSSPTESIVVLETQIDDLNPQAIGYVFEALLAAGALDVFTQAIGMKKSRPGILLTVICHPADVAACEQVIFRETTTLGIRRSQQERCILQREIQSVLTQYGPVRVKVAWSDAAPPDRAPLNVQPEYEDCAAIARQHQVPWRQVHQLALQTWMTQHEVKHGT